MLEKFSKFFKRQEVTPEEPKQFLSINDITSEETYNIISELIDKLPKLPNESIDTLLDYTSQYAFHKSISSANNEGNTYWLRLTQDAFLAGKNYISSINIPIVKISENVYRTYVKSTADITIFFHKYDYAFNVFSLLKQHGPFTERSYGPFCELEFDDISVTLENNDAYYRMCITCHYK